MIHHFYNLLPTSIRTGLYSTITEQVTRADARRMQRIEDQLPKIELEGRHIRHLQVLVDRDALLNLLPKNAVVAELGVAQGNFSEQILSITAPKELHLIDTWSHDKRYDHLKKSVEDRFETEISSHQVFIHQDFSTTGLERFNAGYFDWVYIDTGHDYSTTSQELEICRKKVKQGGVIAGHDYVTGYWLGRVRYGVIEAVHEFCVKHDWEMIYLTHECHRHLSFALRQISDQQLQAHRQS